MANLDAQYSVLPCRSSARSMIQKQAMVRKCAPWRWVQSLPEQATPVGGLSCADAHDRSYGAHLRMIGEAPHASVLITRFSPRHLRGTCAALLRTVLVIASGTRCSVQAVTQMVEHHSSCSIMCLPVELLAGVAVVAPTGCANLIRRRIRKRSYFRSQFLVADHGSNSTGRCVLIS